MYITHLHMYMYIHVHHTFTYIHVHTCTSRTYIYTCTYMFTLRDVRCQDIISLPPQVILKVISVLISAAAIDKDDNKVSPNNDHMRVAYIPYTT